MINADEQYKKALQLEKETKSEEACGLLEEIIKQKPGYENAYEVLAVILHRLGRTDEAILKLRELLQYNPEHIMAYTNLSRFYVSKGLIEEAETEQAEARRLSWKQELKEKGEPEDDFAGPSELEKERILQEKIERYRQVIAFDPEDVLGYFSLGCAYLDGKMYFQSREAFAQAVKTDANHSPSYVGLGQALEALGKPDEATDVYQRGIPIAMKRGDIVPLRKMENRLRKIIN